MKLSSYIEMLQQYVKDFPEHADIPVCMTQGGYYSDGPFADLYLPPEKEVVNYNINVLVDKNRKFGPTRLERHSEEFIVLGSSYQSY